MNRAERRRQARTQAKGEKMISLKASNIAQMKQEATNEAVDIAFCMMLSIPLMVLRDKFGFGKTRLERFINFVIDLYDSFDKGYITFEDLQKTLKEEVDVTFEINKINKNYTIERGN